MDWTVYASFSLRYGRLLRDVQYAADDLMLRVLQINILRAHSFYKLITLSL